MPTYDEALRRKAVRRGRERGVWVFVPAVELEKARAGASRSDLWYRTWGQERGSVLVRLYDSP